MKTAPVGTPEHEAMENRMADDLARSRGLTAYGLNPLQGERGKVKHPAVFSDRVLAAIADALFSDPMRVLDPFAGTGKIHTLDNYHDTVGVELEPEWAAMHPRTIVGNALSLPFADGTFDAIATSPTFANRMADHHDAKDGSVRRSYTHDLGRPLHPDNSGAMQWGAEYWHFHDKAWHEAIRVLKPGGLFILNCKDHYRRHLLIHVTDWHVSVLESLGLEWRKAERIDTPGMRYGANSEQRVGYESVWVLRKP